MTSSPKSASPAKKVKKTAAKGASKGGRPAKKKTLTQLIVGADLRYAQTQIKGVLEHTGVNWYVTAIVSGGMGHSGGFLVTYREV